MPCHPGPFLELLPATVVWLHHAIFVGPVRLEIVSLGFSSFGPCWGMTVQSTQCCYLAVVPPCLSLLYQTAVASQSLYLAAIVIQCWTRRPSTCVLCFGSMVMSGDLRSSLGRPCVHPWSCIFLSCAGTTELPFDICCLWIAVGRVYIPSSLVEFAEFLVVGTPWPQDWCRSPPCPYQSIVADWFAHLALLIRPGHWT